MSFTPAKIIDSQQLDIHDNLEDIVKKHLIHKFNSPIAKHNQTAFLDAHQYWQANNQPKTILDSACGTAESSRYLAKQYPDHLIIGIDQSEKRLGNSHNQILPDNCLLLRAECTDFWRLAEQQHWQFEYHFMFYPNPWPKPQHLMRRWHGHPSLSTLLNISKKIELRTNWKIYADEFLYTLQLARVYSCKLEEYQPEETITAFEKKYQQSNHTLWQVTATI